jgi:hypothetical protein
MNSKNWMVTALTRGKQLVITIGREEAIHRAVLKSTTSDCKTFLKERIQEIVGDKDFRPYSEDAAKLVGETVDVSVIPFPTTTGTGIRENLDDHRERNSCIFCHRPLDHPVSQMLGYGPTCAKNNGLPWGESVTIEDAVDMIESIDIAVDEEIPF